MKILRLWTLWWILEDPKMMMMMRISDTEGWDIGDDGLPQSRSRNNGEGLRRSLASYLGSQRGVTS